MFVSCSAWSINSRSFLLKPQTLFGLSDTSEAVIGLIENASRGPIEIAPGCFVTYDLESRGVDYSTSGGYVDDITDQIDEYREKIVSGEIEVPTTPK